MTIPELAQHFRLLSKKRYGRADSNASPLYAHLAAQIAGERDILALMEDADPATVVGDLLLAAVHDLLLGGTGHRVRNYYPSLVDDPLPVADAFPAFREFCQIHALRLHHLITTRQVQTHEVQRATGFVLAFGLIAERTGHRPLAMVEIGASAGFNLFWDHYTFNYNGVGTIGMHTGMTLNCEVRGEHTPSIPAIFPTVGFRVGIDVAPLNVHKEDDMRWVRAHIWPEHHHRAKCLDQAIHYLRTQSPPLIKGDAAKVLPTVLKGVPAHLPLVIYHSDTLTQLSDTTHDEIINHIRKASYQREIYRVALEWFADEPYPPLRIITYRNGQEMIELLAYCDAYGQWVEWQSRWF